MTLILNGTSDSATTPAVTSADTDTGLYYPAANQVALATNGTQAVLVDASQNMGLGVTPSAWVSTARALDIGTRGSLVDWSTSQQTDIWSNGYYNGTNSIYKTTANASIYRQSVGQHIWYNAPSGTAGNTITFTQAMTLGASGTLFVGTTSDPAGYGGKLSISGSGHCVYVQTTATSGYACMTLARAGATSGDQLYFVTTSGLAGIIASSGTSTTYGTSSDYRLKKDVQPMTGALAKITQLKPVTYKWKADNSASEGFVAHELQEIFPGAVVGEKDAVDEKGNIKPQNIDTSFLVASLTSAIQEQQALITSLTARVAQLENK